MKGFLTFPCIINITWKARFYLVLSTSDSVKQKYRQTLSSTLFRTRFFSRFLLISMLFLGASGNISAINFDTLPVDSPIVVKTGISSTLKDQVTYRAQDSMYFDLDGQKVYLYDSASVDYQEIHVTAHYIIIDFKNSIVTAIGKTDSLGKFTEKAIFEDGEQNFQADSFHYNFKTGKGKISEVTTEEGGGFLLATAAKKDSSGTIYVADGKFTTCDLPNPHFAIRAKKLKVIPNDKIVTGPAYLEISDVPTPLAVPFGFFPNKKGRKSGILIPSYGESPTLGFFLKGGGYYFGISDKMDLAVRGDIYSRGSWGAQTFLNYKVRYKYSGNLALKYSQIGVGDNELPTSYKREDFLINWTHIQDPKFNPSIRFSANVNAGTSTYNTNNSNRPNDYLSTTMQSNVSASKSWKFGQLSANLRHSQNRVTHNLDLTIPQLAFSVNRFYPFRNPTRVTPKWYDKIGMSYNSEFQNNLSMGDTLFNYRHLDYIKSKVRNGIHQSIPISTSLNLFKHFTLTPAITLNSVTQFRTIKKRWDSTNDSLITDTINGAKINLDYSASATLSTRVYGFYYFKHTRYSVIRHIITPNLSFTYIPDFTNEKYGFYKTVQTTASGGSAKYSIYEGGIYGSSPAGRVGAIGVNILNSLEGKLRLKSGDTTGVEKHVSLIDAFNVAFSYNLMADHFNWSLISTGFRTKLFKKIDVNASFLADPYRVSEDSVRIERFEWRDGKRIARLTEANLSLGTSLRKGGLSSSTTHTSTRGTDAEMNMINSNPNGYVDFNIPWSLNVNYVLNWSKPLMTATFTQSVRFSGDVNVTPKWKVGFDSNYDLKKQEFGYTSLNIYRDLHCWELQFNWIPFGIRQSYNVTLNVKSAVLQDLKLTRKRDWYDFSAQ
jgi:hypothetical protein